MDDTTQIRPAHIVLGVDDDGATHHYRTTDETIHVIGRDGGREHVERLGHQSVDAWMQYVERKCGWSTQQYYRDTGNMVRSLAGRVTQA